ncbi:bifunctional hydroxymethylpyrimidine kinase/phosphomethylpyrimidine kinase, partial [Halobacteriales archaeon QH_6_66_25]
MTRKRAPDSRQVVLTIAGSDSGGGAGIQADLKTIGACGGFGTSAVTSVTAQHTRGVESTHVLPPGEVEAQIDAVFED